MLNLSTRELDRARLKLRDDLIVRPLPGSEGVTYQIEDPVAVRFYRVGRAEYLLISLLDGRTTLADAVISSARELGREAFSEQEATSVCLWLVETGLANPLLDLTTRGGDLRVEWVAGGIPRRVDYRAAEAGATRIEHVWSDQHCEATRRHSLKLTVPGARSLFCRRQDTGRSPHAWQRIGNSGAKLEARVRCGEIS
jgi:hypothetical protein